MKTHGLIFLMCFILTATAKPHREDRLDLGLTDKQKTQMLQVQQNQHEQLQKARAQIMAESKKKMATFLTVEQLQKIESVQAHRERDEQMRKERKKRRHAHKRERRSE